MVILGIGGIGSNPACAVLRDGELLSAVEEKKLSRQFSANQLPLASITAALRWANVRPEAVQSVALVRPVPPSAGQRLHLTLRERFPHSELATVEHHVAHAASAYYVSPFDDATVLTLDRAGDLRAGARWHAQGTQLQLERELSPPDSLGELYWRVTDLLGFRGGLDEHKTQWLSTAGDGRFAPLFQAVLGTMDWPRPDRRYFDADRLGAGGFSARFYEELGVPDGDTIPEPLRAHVAAGMQRALEQAVAAMAPGDGPLCLAGGVALNTLLVAALERTRPVFVQPAAGNSGTAIGAVYYAWHGLQRRPERHRLETLCLGPAFSAEEIKQVLENCKLRFRILTTQDETLDLAVRALQGNAIVAWLQGRMEFGPRALGNRSILASPLDPYSTENLNVYIKHREPFRKFAASVPEELVGEYFEVGPNARFIATVGRVKPAHRKRFGAATFGDDLVRVHTVSATENPLYYKLLRAFGEKTGLPVLYNTSFNLFGDPLVCTPRDAVRSFYSSGIDALCVGNFFVEK